MKAPLDRWGRKRDLRALFPDLTEDEALAFRALHEGDRTSAQHLSDEEFAAALRRVAEKGYLDEAILTDSGWRITKHVL
jgi:hypothetical protein